MKIQCVVPVSGGKDSQTCLELAITKFGKAHVIGLFCDTQFEHPLTYEHVKTMERIYDVEIITRCAGDVLSLCGKYKRFPSDQARFCTDELKMRVSRDFYRQLAENQGGFEVWYGMRTGESDDRAKRYEKTISDELYAPHEVFPVKYPKLLEKLGVMFRMPIIDWTKQEVLKFLSGRENPLYAEGFDRVGCFPCQAAGDKHKEKCYQHDAFGQSQLAKVRALSKEIGKPVFRGKGASQRNNEDQLCMLCQI